MASVNLATTICDNKSTNTPNSVRSNSDHEGSSVPPDAEVIDPHCCDKTLRKDTQKWK